MESTLKICVSIFAFSYGLGIPFSADTDAFSGFSVLLHETITNASESMVMI
jgi:hypothetical protein